MKHGAHQLQAAAAIAVLLLGAHDALASHSRGSRGSSTTIGVGFAYSSGSRYACPPPRRVDYCPPPRRYHGGWGGGTSISFGIGSTYYASRSTAIHTGFSTTYYDRAPSRVVYVEPPPPPRVVYVERPATVVYREPERVVVREPEPVRVVERVIERERVVAPPRAVKREAPRAANTDARADRDHLDRAWGLLARERPAEAHRVFASIAERRLQDAEPRIGYALAAALRRDDGGAAWAMRRAFEFDPNNAALPNDYQVRMVALGVLERFEDRAARFRGDVDALFTVAALRYVMGDYAGALDALDEAAEKGDRAASSDNLRELLEPLIAPAPIEEG